MSDQRIGARIYGVNVGSDYSDEEREFLQAIEGYKRQHRRPFPTWREVLKVFKALGWRKMLPSNLDPHD